MNKHKIVLNALLIGQEITYTGMTIRLFKDGDEIPMPNGDYICDGYWLGTSMKKGTDTVYVGIDMSFIDFLNMVNSQSDETIALLSSSSALTKINNSTLYGVICKKS